MYYIYSVTLLQRKYRSFRSLCYHNYYGTSCIGRSVVLELFLGYRGLLDPRDSPRVIMRCGVDAGRLGQEHEAAGSAAGGAERQAGAGAARHPGADVGQEQGAGRGDRRRPQAGRGREPAEPADQGEADDEQAAGGGQGRRGGGVATQDQAAGREPQPAGRPRPAAGTARGGTERTSGHAARPDQGQQRGQCLRDYFPAFSHPSQVDRLVVGV